MTNNKMGKILHEYTSKFTGEIFFFLNNNLHFRIFKDVHFHIFIQCRMITHFQNS